MDLTDKLTGPSQQLPRLHRTQTVGVENTNFFSEKRKKESLRGRWTDEEHRLFLEGVLLFKKDWR